MMDTDNNSPSSFQRDILSEESSDYDESESDVFSLFHRMRLGDSSLSFDIICPEIEITPNDSSISTDFVTGTQEVGSITLVHLYNLYHQDEDEGDEIHQPRFHGLKIPTQHGINRLRCQKINELNLVAAWSTFPRIDIYDISKEYCTIQEPNITNSTLMETINVCPIATDSTHRVEGFALDWSKTEKNLISSGDNSGLISIYDVVKFESIVRLEGSTKSIEDINWSPVHRSILASCGCDQRIKLWDIRANIQTPITGVHASDSDINVISWSNHKPLLLSGDENGIIKCWDLRNLSETNPKPIGIFHHFDEPTTSIEWNPDNNDYFCSSSDSLISIWNIASSPQSEGSQPVPLVALDDTLVEAVKEIHWHPKHNQTILSVDYEGLLIFKISESLDTHP